MSGQLVEQWPLKTLGELCQIRRGQSPRPIKAHITDDEDGVNWIKIKDAGDDGKYIFKAKQKIHKKSAEKLVIVNDGDFILTNSMSFGRPYIVRTTGCVHDGWLIFSEYQNHLNQDYLYYALNSPNVSNQFEQMARGSTVRNLNIELVKKTVLPVPPIEEQQRIVRILDKAFENTDTAIVMIEKNVINAVRLFENYLDSLFEIPFENGVQTTLGDVCDLKNGFAFKSKDYIDSSNTLNIRMSNIRPNGDFNPDHKPRYLPDSFASEYEKYRLFDGDLVIAMTDMAGEPKILGVPTEIKKLEGRTFLLNQRVGKLCDFDNNLYIPFLRYFLSAPRMKRLFKKKGGVGTLQINLSKKDILSVPISLPSLDKQKELVKSIETMKEHCSVLETSQRNELENVIQFKQSILQEAFNGTLQIA